MSEVKCSTIRLYSMHRHSCGNCVIDLNNHNELTNLDLKSIVTIIFIVSTNSNVSTSKVSIRDNKLMCSGVMFIDNIYTDNNAELLNIEYCISLLNQWVENIESMCLSKEVIARQYINTLKRVKDIQSMRQSLLYMLR